MSSASGLAAARPGLEHADRGLQLGGGAVLASAPRRGTVAVGRRDGAFYTAGMILNDLLDYEVDVRERPERPLPSGAVSRPPRSPR